MRAALLVGALCLAPFVAVASASQYALYAEAQYWDNDFCQNYDYSALWRFGPHGDRTGYVGDSDEPRISADGRVLAYEHEGSVFTLLLYASPAVPVKLTQPAGGPDSVYPVAISPDGERVLVEADFYNDKTDRDLLRYYVIGRDGGVSPVPLGPKVELFEGAWSRTNLIAVRYTTSDEDGVGEANAARIGLLSLAGKLTPLKVRSTSGPVWTPAGRIAITNEFDYVISTIPAHGGRKVTFLKHAAQPAWSPDGSRLAYVRTGKNHDSVWLAGARGDHPRKLARAPGQLMPRHFAWGLATAALAPPPKPRAADC